MRKIVGTIVRLKSLMENKESNIKIDIGKGREEDVFALSIGREYIVPGFQRELRWGQHQLLELIRDVKSSNKFLGNIIFNKKGNNYFEIIDGQQRFIIIHMILDFLKTKYGQDQDIFDKCSLKLKNFLNYNILVDNNYNLKELSETDKRMLLEGDFYGQRQKFNDLYNIISKIDFFQIKGEALNFYKNLCDCCFNVIIISDDNTSNVGIEYFLDVNLKGLKLDDEDIFKGYLFSLDNSENMITLWNNVKKLIFDINFYREENIYNLCSFLQHFLYCYLYDNEKFQDIEFGNDFLIEKDIEIDGEKHFVGEHIIKVIWSKKFFENMFLEAIKVLKNYKRCSKKSNWCKRFIKKYFKTNKCR